MLKRLTTLALFAAFALGAPLAVAACEGHADGTKHECASHDGKPCPLNGGKPCDEACMKTCAEKHAAGGDKCPMAKHDCAAHAGKPCPMAGHADHKCAAHDGKPCPLNGGKPCDEACMKTCKEKHAADGDKCPMAGHADHDCAAHAGKPCPMNGGKPCDEACMKSCKEKHAAGGCPHAPASTPAPAASAPDAHPGHQGEKAPASGKGDGVKTCPVSGEPVDPALDTVINGRKVKFCCPDCVKAAKKNPAKFITPTTGVPAAN